MSDGVRLCGYQMLSNTDQTHSKANGGKLAQMGKVDAEADSNSQCRDQLDPCRACIINHDLRYL